MSRKDINIKCEDVIEGVAEAILEQIPIVNFFVSAISKVKDGCLTRRFDNWQQMVNERLSTINDTIFATIGDNENFATTFIKATELAAKSNKIKMECLANAVQYVATNKIDEDYIIIFLNCIDRYTIKHLEALCSFQTVSAFWNISMDRVINGIDKMPFFRKNYPNIDGGLAKTIIDDLRRDGLYRDDNFVNKKDNSTLYPRTTDLGNKFIEFFGLNDISYENGNEK